MVMVSRIHSCRVLKEEGGVQKAGKLGSTQGTASLCNASEIFKENKGGWRKRDTLQLLKPEP